MMDQDVVFVSPSTTYRVLKNEGIIAQRKKKRATKGNGFDHPTLPHQQWHMDISNIKIQGIFYYLICVLDGFSRSIVHWDLRTEMKEEDVGIVQQGAKEKFPDEYPRYITDNGKQFTGKEFRNFISDNRLTHWTTSPYYPQSNGKLERFHKSIKEECIKKKCPLTLEDAKRIITQYIAYYNNERLHSAIGYVSPEDRLTGKDQEIHKERERKLEERRADRKATKMKIKNTILEDNKKLNYQL